MRSIRVPVRGGVGGGGYIRILRLWLVSVGGTNIDNRIRVEASARARVRLVVGLRRDPIAIADRCVV